MEKKMLKRTLFVSLLTLSAITMDTYIPINKSASVKEARFLGIGVKITTSPCIGGSRYVTREFTILWIRMGESWTVEEPCE